MIIDARLLPAGETIETDVCIVGSGPAGITLARELIHQNFRVCLLESGSLELPDRDLEALAAVETANPEFEQVTADRRNRRFGGNSSFWSIQIGNGKVGLRHRPLDEVDFEQRDWMPHSGWPFSRDHLLPYYERAQRVFQMGPFAYEGADWADNQSPCLPFMGDRVTTRVFQFSPGAVFFEQYRREIDEAKNITTYIHANVTQLEADATGQHVTGVQVACLNGNRFTVSARIVVLAVGGIEAAQLLLLSNSVQKAGLGNEHDLVGRFFMDHPLVHGGLFIPNSTQMFNRTALYDLRVVNGVPVMGALALTDAVMRRENLPNISVNLFPRAKRYRTSEAIESLKALLKLRSFKEGKVLQHLSQALAGTDEIAGSIYDKITRQQVPFWSNFSTGGWSYLQPNREKAFYQFEVLHQTEQLPHPDNRVLLSDDCDLLGRRRAQVQSCWRQADIDGVKRAQQVFAEEIARAGLGRFVIEREGDLPILSTPGTSHHMGTTRMHNSARQGVVDANCRVHSVSNLYIASSSVFPTGGYANPTLTIAALSLRLADRIKNLMTDAIELRETAKV